MGLKKQLKTEASTKNELSFDVNDGCILNTYDTTSSNKTISISISRQT
jgi:hypothetical protein